MGQEAKLKSLRVIEVLRQSKIPVYHSLTKDKLTAQLMSAENLQSAVHSDHGSKRKHGKYRRHSRNEQSLARNCAS
jgi:hypothetical protein